MDTNHMNNPQRPRQPATPSPFRATDVVPARRIAQKQPVDQSAVPTPRIDQRTDQDLASQRELFGFDDIPVDVDDVPMSQIVRAWLRRGMRHSELEKHSKHVKSALNRKRIGGIKDDIKWAMAADLDEEELRPKSAPTASPPHHTNPSSTAQHAAPTSAPTSKSVDININFGEFPKLPKFAPKKLIRRVKPSKKTLLISGVILVFAGVGVTAWQFFAPNEYKLPIFGKEAVSPDKASLPKETPAYTTLTPDGASVEDWTRISPESSAPAYSYADTVEDTRIIVTQQQLPNGVRPGDDAELARIAASFSATDKHTDGDVVFYLGSAGGSTQHLITSKDGLLILIRAEQSIGDEAWSRYLYSLK